MTEAQLEEALTEIAENPDTIIVVDRNGTNEM